MSEEFDNQEGKEAEVTQDQIDQQAEAQNTQSNAGVPPSVISTNKPQKTVAVQTQTVGNVSMTQAQKDQASQATVTQNIEGDRKAHEQNENLRLLKRIVGSASPIVEEQEDTEEQTDAAGNKVQVPIRKKVTTGYSYYAINGKPFTEWVAETFGGEISIDEKNNKIIYNNTEGGEQ